MAKQRVRTVEVTRDWQPGDVALCMEPGTRIYGHEVIINGPLHWNVYEQAHVYEVRTAFDNEPGAVECLEPKYLEPHRFQARPVSRILIERLTEENADFRRLIGYLKSVIQSGDLWTAKCQRQYDSVMGRRKEPP